MHIYTHVPLVFGFGQGTEQPMSLHYSLFELLEISHLNSIGKDLFDLLHVS